MTNYKVTSKLHSAKPRHSEPSLASRALRTVISWYQQLRAGRLSPCRFYPSCSEFAAEAIEVHGALKGSLLALRRLSKCRPLGPHGIDLVPESKKVRTSAP